LPIFAALPKVVGQREGDVLATHPFGGALMVTIGLGLVLEDDVIDGDAIVEAAPVVEVDHFIHGVGRLGIINVGERPAVAHDLQRSAGVIEPEEASGTFAVEAVALGRAVLAGATVGAAVDDRLRDEQAMEGGRVEHLVGVQVVALSHSVRVAFLGDEVEPGVDLVLAVGEEEPHRMLALAVR
jgi:hypothetical protein